MRTSLIILLFASLQGFSQSSTKDFHSVSFNYQNGTILPTTDFVKGDTLMGTHTIISNVKLNVN